MEGPDGTGKTSQAKRLVAALNTMGIAAFGTAEPAGTPLGAKIRAILGETTDPKTSLWLFLAARQEHMSQVIRPHLEGEEVVVCDRFALSTLAYQGEVWAPDTIAHLNDIATGGLRPDLTIVYDATDDTLLRRRGDLDALDERYLQMRDGVVRRFREQVASGDPSIVRIEIDGLGIEEVHQQTLAVVRERLQDLHKPQPVML